MNYLAIVLIGIYQKYISPRKGFRCAHGIYFGGDSCSKAVKKIIHRRGLIRGYSDIRQQFSRCSLAYAKLSDSASDNKKRKKKKKQRDNGYCDFCCDACDWFPVTPGKGGGPKGGRLR